MKQAKLTDFLTEKQIQNCLSLYYELKDTGKFASVVAENIIEPNIKEINEKLGQENDPKYLAYAIEYVFLRSSE